MVFHCSLSDSKSSQVSGTLLSILAVLNNVVVWIVSTRPPTSKSSRPFNNTLLTVPKEPITIGIIVTCWNMKVTIIPTVIGAFGTVTKGLLKGLEDLEVDGRVETIQTIALLRTVRTLRRVQETRGDVL